MERIAAAGALALALALPAHAQTYRDTNGSIIPGVTIAGGPYTLASNVNTAGTTNAVSVLKNPNYIFACVATSWGGASAQLQALGPDGSTWLTGGVSALSANGTVAVQIGAAASVRVNVTGTPTGLSCSLS